MLNELYKILEKPNKSIYGDIVQKIIFFNIFINIFVGFLPYVFHLKQGVLNVFGIIEYLTLIFFILELLLRYIVIGRDKQYRGILGRIKFTFTKYIIIDILAILPYLITSVEFNSLFIKIFRFIRLLKFLRFKKILRSFFDIGSFATSNIIMQMIILFITGVVFILLFKFAYSSPDASIMIFLDPPALVEAKTTAELLFGIIELILGLFVAGAFISIITEALTNITNSVKKGYHPYKGKNHIIIINNNPKLDFIMKEINYYDSDMEKVEDIVVFLPFEKDIEGFRENLSIFSNLDITLISGDALNWNSYEKLNINQAKKIIILLDKTTELQYQDIKITTYILSNKNFTNKNLEFIIETEDITINHEIYKYIFKSKVNDYALLNHLQILESFLNRSIINADFYRIFSSLLSFKNSEISIIKCKKIFKEKLTFKEAFMQIDQGVIVGIIQNNIILLNPNKDHLIQLNDKLIIFFKTSHLITLQKEMKYTIHNEILPSQKLQINKKVCIIGNHLEMQIENITQFLTKNSIENLTQISYKKGQYKNHSFWDSIIDKKYDTLIFNIEDEEEFITMLYLNNTYATNIKFLQSIVNIIHSPTVASLLSGNNNFYNIILSEKIAGQYIAQVIFNKNIINIFEELTHMQGNEFYIYTRKNNNSFFNMSYLEIKATLLENNMLYIGTISQNKFIANDTNIKESEKIVVIAIGQNLNKNTN